ncbi:MAG: SpoIIE family protein phosphatase [Lentisphaeria bacterium]|nr:SpoIIE family protein phosphatase [Victivallales bacterium]MCR4572802.1 SpoIIE family protein phosphatase [Lentisphaeria bacterium]
MSDKKKQILVIDDEKFSLTTVQACLRGENYELSLCLDPLEAYSQFKKAKRFDVIITDINMNAINGFDLRDLIRASDKLVPIIFMSAMTDNLDNALMRQISSDRYSYYMNKSFKKKDLLVMLDRVLEVPNALQEISRLKNSQDNDLKLAGQIQKLMLPPWSMVNEDFVASYVYEPQSLVSGDLHELFPLGNHRYISIVGDISGHGVSAALCMTPILLFIRSLIEKQPVEKLTPDFILTQLNNIFCDNFHKIEYMSCLIALWDFENNHLTYQTAGHPDLLCLDFKSKKLQTINPDKIGSGLIGIEKGSQFPPEYNIEFDFTEDHLFLAYTDGLFDIGSKQYPDSFIEESELYDLITSLTDTECTVTLPFLIRNFIEQIGYDFPSDDIFLFAIRKNTTAQHQTFISKISTDINETNTMLDRVHEYLTSATEKCLTSQEDSIEILLGEVLINAVQHGKDIANAAHNGIIVQIRPLEDKVEITVLERGVFWDTDRSFSGAEMDRLLNELNDNFMQHGRGLPLIYSIASTVTRMHYHGLNKSVFYIDNN